mmetsp:Transcript_10985/g.21933  ORF Transcript_10985/g.21933 Transcript_10985/m.21933 type:complete len:236 (+) Transcript_10985:359-1066(+)
MRQLFNRLFQILNIVLHHANFRLPLIRSLLQVLDLIMHTLRKRQMVPNISIHFFNIMLPHLFGSRVFSLLCLLLLIRLDLDRTLGNRVCLLVQSLERCHGFLEHLLILLAFFYAFIMLSPCFMLLQNIHLLLQSLLLPHWPQSPLKFFQLFFMPCHSSTLHVNKLLLLIQILLLLDQGFMQIIQISISNRHLCCLEQLNRLHPCKLTDLVLRQELTQVVQLNVILGHNVLHLGHG